VHLHITAWRNLWWENSRFHSNLFTRLRQRCGIILIQDNLPCMVQVVCKDTLVWPLFSPIFAAADIQYLKLGLNLASVAVRTALLLDLNIVNTSRIPSSQGPTLFSIGRITLGSYWWLLRHPRQKPKSVGNFPPSLPHWGVWRGSLLASCHFLSMRSICSSQFP